MLLFINENELLCTYLKSKVRNFLQPHVNPCCNVGLVVIKANENNTLRMCRLKKNVLYFVIWLILKTSIILYASMIMHHSFNSMTIIAA